MKTAYRSLARPIYALLALGFLISLAAPGALLGRAHAAQLGVRSIKLSDSAISTTSVTNLITFTASANFGAFIVDFCSNSPIIGLSTCTAPTGLSTTSTAGTTTSGSLGTLTVTQPTTNSIKVVGSGTATSGVNSFTITGMVNPSSVGTYYARVYTYTNGTTGYVSYANPGTTIDTGGIAMAINNVIAITARVQESLQFCVSGAIMTSNCTSMSTPTLTLGHNSPATLDNTATDTANAFTQISTNAQSGATVRMKNSNACGGLSRDGGTTCDIAPTGATAIAITAGNALFGLRASQDAGGTGTTTVATAYASGSNYGMDNSTANNNVSFLYGSTLYSSTGALATINHTLVFAASASSTTPAGIYTANMDLIATGTF